MSSRNTPPTEWDRYWQSDRIASCAGFSGRNYDPRFLVRWREFFTSLESGARLLDLCTGNGAVPLVALEVSEEEGKDFEIDAVDRADIDPARFVASASANLGKISFHGNTRIEALPFDDATFDAVTSQYGIEYADLDLALPEIARVLKPGGRAQFVMHAKGGYADEMAALELCECEDLLTRSKLFGIARTTFEQAAAIEQKGRALDRKGRRRMARITSRFSSAIEIAKTNAKDSCIPIIHQNATSVLVDTFNKRAHFPLRVLTDKVASLENEVRAHMGRVSALRSAAKSEYDIQKLQANISDLGFEVAQATPVTLDEAGSSRLYGWTITACKR